MATAEEKGSKKQGGHANSPAYPGRTVNFHHGKTLCQNFSQRQKKESQIQNSAESANKGGVSPHSECKKGNKITRQKLPGKRVKNIKKII
jgi:hypothetical protein